MDDGENGKICAEKAPSATTSQDQSPATSQATVNPDWSGFQAYSPIPPHGFLASNPQVQPYMWGVQPILPPYGTPPHPYVAMYPQGGVYAHPSIPPGSYPFSPFAVAPANGLVEATGNSTGSMEADTKHGDTKEKLPVKRSKGSLGSLNMITGKSNEPCEMDASANGGYTRSAESASDGTSEGSDANSQSDSHIKSSSSRQVSMEADSSLNDVPTHGQEKNDVATSRAISVAPISTAGEKGTLSGPTTNLKIGMEYWGAPASSALSSIHGKVPSTVVSGGVVTAGSRDVVHSQLWLQDERELKRQKRKQSNRESARRSRLRKQAECDELAQRSQALTEENIHLRDEINRIKNEYEELLAENVSLRDRLGEDIAHEVGVCEPLVMNETQENDQIEYG